MKESTIKKTGAYIEVFSERIKYYFNKALHREDGPAVVCADGSKEWFQKGKLHREDGPAIAYGGTKLWFQNGNLIEEEKPKTITIENRTYTVGDIIPIVIQTNNCHLFENKHEPKRQIICKKCNTINEYLDKPNQPDGTHICYSCRS